MFMVAFGNASPRPTEFLLCQHHEMEITGGNGPWWTWCIHWKLPPHDGEIGRILKIVANDSNSLAVVAFIKA